MTQQGRELQNGNIKNVGWVVFLTFFLGFGTFWEGGKEEHEDIFAKHCKDYLILFQRFTGIYNVAVLPNSLPDPSLVAHVQVFE